MGNSEFDLVYFTQLFQKRARLIATIIGITVVLFLALYLVLPKKYKSDSQITIYSRYFQNPLVKDFISEQYDPTEMRTQREAVLQQAINDAFVDEIGEQFKLYKTPANSPKRSGEREDLRKRFEIFALSSDSFGVGFIANNPQLAQDISKRTLEQVIHTLVDERRKTIMNVRNAIRDRMEAMVLFQNTGPGSLGSSSRPQIEARLGQIRSQINSLLQQYTDRHPKVVQLRARERALEQYLARTAPAGKGADSTQTHVTPDTLAGSDVEAGSKEVYQDLLKKYNYLNVALDMEQANEVNYYAVVSEPTLPLSAIAPKLVNFLSYGLGAGVLLALFILLFDEYVRFSAADAEKKAEFWGIPLLGSIPPMTLERGTQTPLQHGSGKQPNDWN